MTEPPARAIEYAIKQARNSPCAKSKRGAVIFHPLAPHIVSAGGFNGQPDGFECTGSEYCRKACRRICAHAEQRAIRRAVPVWSPMNSELVHVKVVDGELVAGGPPSCVECSTLIVDVGFIARVWLYEVTKVPAWRSYTAREFHSASLFNNGICP